jgi:opacity protein-like surface antigen
MKTKIFTTVLPVIFAVTSVDFAAAAVSAKRTTQSADGVKVINNFNYGTNVRLVQPAQNVRPVQAAQPRYVARPVMYTEYPAQVEAPVAIAAKNVRQVVAGDVQPIIVEDVQPVVVRRESAAQFESADRHFYQDWYAGLKYVHTFANFTSKHYTNGVYCVGGQFCKDEYSFVSMMGLAASVGKWYDEDWRIELEGGWTGEYSDSADGIEFAFSAPYLTFSALYNFSGPNTGGFYAGPGAGIAFPTSRITGPVFLTGSETKRQFSPMLALQLGYQYPFSDRFALDIGYKLSTFGGTDHTRQFELWDPNTGQSLGIHDFTNKTGWFINNSLSIGLRYYF